MGDTSFTNYENHGLSGLANVGNTCYLNSCMQILSHTYELNDFLKVSNYKMRLNRIPDSVLLLEWDNLRELMWSENCTIAPNGFVSAIQKIAAIKNKPLFSGGSQNDISEFLLFMIESFHNSLSREVPMTIKGSPENSTDVLAIKCYKMMQTMYKTEYSEMLDIFFGISVSQIKSVASEDILSCNPEPFCILSLSIPETDPRASMSLFDCMAEYCKQERLEGENAYLNETTNEKEAVDKGICFWSLPKIMIIDIKRYNMEGRKLNNLITAEIDNADFSKYVIGYNKSAFIYDLYGVCNHLGGMQGGHYTCSIRNANGRWYEFNDTHVTEISPEQVISNKSYCFFYRKKNRLI